jgi:glycosyltransferase involved in cell wall biosynthesis
MDNIPIDEEERGPRIRSSSVPGEVNVSIVIPAFNEEQSIASQIQAVRQVMDQTEWVYEIIVVNDGSTDGTAKEAAGQGAKLISLPENRGYGAALKTGIAKAQADLIVIIDADGTYPCAAIPELLSKVDQYDMVVAARTGRDVHIPFERRAPKWFLNHLASYLAGRHIPDINSGLRVFKKPLVERFQALLPSGFSFTTTITLALLCNDFQVLYVPIDYLPRQGKSKIRPIDFYNFIVLIVRATTIFNPLKIYLPFGAIFFLGGMSKLIYDIVTHWNLSEGAIMGLFSAGIIWAIGLLADLITKIVYMQRPQ